MSNGTIIGARIWLILTNTVLALIALVRALLEAAVTLDLRTGVLNLPL